jgi:hypothetical protein
MSCLHTRAARPRRGSHDRVFQAPLQTVCTALAVLALACGGHDSTGPTTHTPKFSVSVTGAGAGSGTITSAPAGISCRITGGAAGSSGCSAQFDSGASTTLTAVSDAGSKFAAWGGDCAGSGSCAVVVAHAVTTSAGFDRLPAISLAPTSVTFNATSGGANPAPTSVSVTNSGGGSVSAITVGSIQYGAGATGWLSASLASTSAPTSLALHATTGSLGVGSYTATVPIASSGATNSPQMVTITFTIAAVGGNAMLTVNGGGTGSGSIASQSGLTPAIACAIVAGLAGTTGCAASYPSGTSVTLTATAGAASTFGGWSGACSGTGTCAVTTSTSDRVVVATFAPTAVGSHAIAFEGSRLGSNDIWKVNPDGTGLLRLTTDQSNYAPGWSPDGSKIVYAHTASPGSGLFIMNANGTGATNLATGAVVGPFSPKWSADGTHIVFVDHVGESGAEVWSVKADGTGLLQLTNDATMIHEYPTWCADGRIVFDAVPLAGGAFQVYIMNGDGTNVTPLTNAGSASGGGFRAACSPDGHKVAFVDLTGKLRVMNVDGSGSVALGPIATFPPSWSPDGKRLVFKTRPDATAPGYYRIDLDGTGLTLVLSTESGDGSEAWAQ